ncbi:hypothetical protein D3C77_436100 [compost metagenome]
MPHRYSVINADGVEFKRHAASFADCFLNDFTEFLQMHMARNDIDVRVAYRDKRFAEILVLNAGSSQQAAMRRAVEAFFDHI